jgi:hypothetical protein
MIIDFDQQLGGFADDEAVPDDVIPARGLIVAAPAAHGNDLVLESQVMVDSMKGLPFAMFYEPSEADPLVDEWKNRREFADAMHLAPGILPTEAEADAWLNRTIGERLEKWRPQLEERGLWPL